MSFVTASKNAFSVKAYVGDKKTLLAFNFSSQDNAKKLAGFSIFCQPPGQVPGYYLQNNLRFEDPSKHKQVASEAPNSTANAPIQKYRWTHYPGTAHQGVSPALGNYTYTVTPRYFDASGSMRALDTALSVPVTVPVGPFKKSSTSLGFTRGYMQSQAYAHNFGKSTPIVPGNRQLEFDTNTQAGTDNNGQPVTFAQIYNWMGETAREQIFDVLDRVLNDSSLTLKVFAYDLNEPDIVKTLLTLAAQKRVRVILDNAKLHVTQPGDPQTPEDQFTALFKQQQQGWSGIERGAFARYSHDKIFIVLRNQSAIEVLTGSTNFSLTGLYVNANHVLVFQDANVAGHYDQVFEKSWQILSNNRPPNRAAANAFSSTDLATQPYESQAGFAPKMQITFSPHTPTDANNILTGISDRITQETHSAKGNVLFAVMQLQGGSPVYQTLIDLHTQPVYSYGISDEPQGIVLYSPAQASGVKVTGKPGQVTLPPPFDQVPSPPGHEIHDKFVVCGINGDDPVVYCGSSNLALGGEQANGDNLLAIHDADVATAFAIEALGLVDHYNFLDRLMDPKKAASKKKASAASAAKKAPPKKKASGASAAKKAAPKKKKAGSAAKKAPRRKKAGTAAKRAPSKRKAVHAKGRRKRP
jgi:phosphatidylserine/phosphatidylglycerophosphate/cardiolipin synthase-like enzyme